MSHAEDENPANLIEPEYGLVRVAFPAAASQPHQSPISQSSGSLKAMEFRDLRGQIVENPMLSESPPTQGKHPCLAPGSFAVNWQEFVTGCIHPWIMVAPLDAPEEVIGRCWDAFLVEKDLDGMTFYRAGAPSGPWWLSLIRLVLLKPFRWLLEMPAQSSRGWLGWRNQMGEWLGAWVFGVNHRDPFFPLRIVKVELIRDLSFQCHGDMFWMEMLAKLHFLGAKLMEKPIPHNEFGGKDWPAPTGFGELGSLFRRPEFRRPVHSQRINDDHRQESSVSATGTV